MAIWLFFSASVSPHLPCGSPARCSGFTVALGFPPGFEEALKFILPGYFAGLLVVEMKGWMMPLICARKSDRRDPGCIG